MVEKEKLRIDKYLWSIRVFKTRNLAAEACQKGKVRFNGVPVKASKLVAVDDLYDIRTEARKWLIKVTGLLDHRVDYTTSLNYYLDMTPAEVKEQQPAAFVFYTGKRKSKQGRPTKKNKRDLDGFIDGLE